MALLVLQGPRDLIVHLLLDGVEGGDSAGEAGEGPVGRLGAEAAGEGSGGGRAALRGGLLGLGVQLGCGLCLLLLGGLQLESPPELL